MTGDAPQPGETPRKEGEPWSYTDPGAPWWRVSPDREAAETLTETATNAGPHHRRTAPATPVRDGAAAAFAPEGLDAHAAGAQDAAAGLRADPESKPEEGYAGSAAAEETSGSTATGDEKAPRGELLDLSDRTPGVPDIMVLPEPLRDRGPGPTDSGFAPRGRTRSQATPGVLDPDRAAQIENSRFWLTDAERAAAGSAWPIPEPRDHLADSPGPDAALRGKPPAHRPRSPGGPIAGLLSLVALGLIAAFFSWVSAAPFWLAVGHGDPGTATVTRCTGSGITQRCSGSFSAADGSFQVPRVTLLGVDPNARAGTPVPARMVGADSRQAYVGATGPLIHLRWTLSFALVLLCGFGIAALSGARRLETARARRAAVLVSLAGPVLLLVGFLSAGY